MSFQDTLRIAPYITTSICVQIASKRYLLSHPRTFQDYEQGFSPNAVIINAMFEA